MSEFYTYNQITLSFNKIWYLSSSGSDSNPGTRLLPKLDLPLMIANAATGDAIILLPGFVASGASDPIDLHTSGWQNLGSSHYMYHMSGPNPGFIDITNKNLSIIGEYNTPSDIPLIQSTDHNCIRVNSGSLKLYRLRIENLGSTGIGYNDSYSIMFGPSNSSPYTSGGAIYVYNCYLKPSATSITFVHDNIGGLYIYNSIIHYSGTMEYWHVTMTEYSINPIMDKCIEIGTYNSLVPTPNSYRGSNGLFTNGYYTEVKNDNNITYTTSTVNAGNAINANYQITTPDDINQLAGVYSGDYAWDLSFFEPLVESNAWKQIQAGKYHSLQLIESDSILFSWGNNQYGQLGIGNTIDNWEPITVGLGTTLWKQIQSGKYHSLQLRESDSMLFSWGNNQYGQLGIGNTINNWTPILVGTTAWKQIYAGYYHNLQIRETDSIMYSWGWNLNGQLGTGNTIDKWTPISIVGTTAWKQIQGGYYNSLQIREIDSVLFSWGDNNYGQLGIGNETIKWTPTEVIGSTSWKQIQIGEIHSLQLRETDSILFSWGRNLNGELGIGNTTNKWNPTIVGTTTWKQIQGGKYHSLYISDQFTIIAISSLIQGGTVSINGDTQGTNVNKNVNNGDLITLVAVVNNGYTFTNWTYNGTNISINQTYVFNATMDSTYIANFDNIHDSGQLFGWGSEEYGQIGRGNTGTIIIYTPIQIGSIIWRQIQTGSYHSLQIRETDSMLFSWGRNNQGQLGLGNLTNTNYPVSVGTTVWSQISARGQQHSLQIRKTDSILFSWGWNGEGELGIGIGNTRNQYTPIIAGLGITSWKQISNGTFHSLQIRESDSILFSWGYNGNGELGTGNTIDNWTPILVGATAWKQISGGERYSLQIRDTDSMLFSWGKNTFGELGIGNINNYNWIPISVGSTSWKQISAGYQYSLQIRDTDSVLFSWGKYELLPQSISTTSWKQISAGGRYYSLQVRQSDSKLFQWGAMGNQVYNDTPKIITESFAFKIIEAGQYHSLQIGNSISYIITAISNPTYGGTVSINNDTQGINVNKTVSGGTHVALYATISTGYLFTNWASDGLNVSTNQSYNFNATEIKTYTANFIIENLTITAISNPVQGGTVSINSETQGTNVNKTVNIDIGKTITLFATITNNNYLFANWTYNGNIITSDYTYTFEQTTNQTYYANFHEITGYLYSFGNNQLGELGIGNTINQYTPIPIGTTIWKSIQTGWYHSLQIRDTDSKLFAWGYNYYGQCGINSIISINQTPIPILSDNNWKQIQGGESHSLQIRETDSMLFQFGNNDHGALGIGITTLYRLTSSPYTIQIESNHPMIIGSTAWKQIQAGSNQSFQIRETDSILFSWGSNDYHQIGRYAGQFSVCNIGITSWKQIQAGWYHSLQIRDADSMLFSWGTNSIGQLGIGNTIDNWTPISVGTTPWKQIQGGYQHSLQIRETDSKIFSWGYNNYGQLGIGNRINSQIPTPIVGITAWKQIQAGGYHSLQIRETDSKLFSWGRNLNGELGMGNTMFLFSPTPVPVVEGFQQKKIQVGYDHSIQIEKMDTDIIFQYTITVISSILYDGTINGTVNINNDNYGTNMNKIVNNENICTIHALPNNFYNFDYWHDGITIISYNIYYSFIPASNKIFTAYFSNTQNTIFQWGYNGNGELGIGNTTKNYIPISILGSTAWKQIQTGFNHSLQIRETDSKLFGWGNNNYGEIGIGNTINNFTPIAIGLTIWKQIQGGRYHTLQIRQTDSMIFSWGYNNYGQLGIGNTITKLAPTTIIGTTIWKQIHGGQYNSFQIRETDSKLFGWGNNQWGELGIGNTINTWTPTIVGLGTTSWKQIQNNGFHTLQLRYTDSILFQWGYNYYGELGIGNTINNWTPIAVAGTTIWKQIQVSSYHSIQIRDTDSMLFSWGKNTFGELGIGNTTNNWTPISVGTTPWKQIQIGYYNNLQISETDSMMYSWGWNQNGELGIGNTINKWIPVPVGITGWKQIQGKGYHFIQIKEDTYPIIGVLELGYPEILNNNTNEIEIINDIKITNDNAIPITSYSDITTNNILINTIKYPYNLDIESGNLIQCGWNGYGQLGIGNTIDNWTPISVGTTVWKQIQKGYQHSLQIRETDSTIFSWGYNNYGQLGIGNLTNKWTPTEIVSTTVWKQIQSSEIQAHTLQLKEIDYIITVITNNIEYGSIGINNDPYAAINSIRLIFGTSVTLYAIPNNLYQFDNWHDGSNIVSNSSTYSFLSNYTKTYTANFSPINTELTQYNITIIVNIFEQGVVTINSSPQDIINNLNCKFGETITIYAESNDLNIYQFDNWNDESNIVSTNNTYTFVCYSTKTYIANFSKVVAYQLFGFGYYPSTMGTTIWKQIENKDYIYTQIRESDSMLFYYPRYTSTNSVNPLPYTSFGLGIGSNIWTQLSEGLDHSLQIRDGDSMLFQWGNNAYGQLGFNESSTAYHYLPLVVGSTSWKQIYGGWYYSIQLRNTDSVLFSWGYNQYGQLGIGNTIVNWTPIPVIGTTSWKQVQVHRQCSLQIRDTDSMLFSWGWNGYGQLGIGNTIDNWTPISVGITIWKQIQGGNVSSLQLRESDSMIFSWGQNSVGQLGIGNSVNNWTPKSVGTTVWKQIQSGLNHSLQIRETDSMIFSWGYNEYGQLGIGTTINKWTPISVIGTTIWKQIQGGERYSLQLAKSDFIITATVNSSDFGRISLNNFNYSDNISISCNFSTNNITLYAQSNKYYKFDNWYDGTIISSTNPIYAFTPISSKSFICNFSLASGQLFQWGRNQSGQLGTGNRIDNWTPISIGTTIWKQIQNSGYHSLQIRETDSILFQWGNNQQGQLGIGNTIEKWTPTSVGTTSWKQVQGGQYHSLQIRETDSMIFSWGYNKYCQLGIGNTIDNWTPISVGTTIWKQIQSRLNHSLQIRETDSMIFSWGSNYYGELGYNASQSSRLHPHHIGTTIWKQVSSGYYNSTQIREQDSKVFSWGWNDQGGLGTGNTTNNWAPILSMNNNSYKFVTTGKHSLLLYDTIDQPQLLDVTIQITPINQGYININGIDYYGDITLTFSFNEEIILLSIANPNYIFDNWSYNNKLITYGSQYVFNISNIQQTYVATFKNTYSPGYLFQWGSNNSGELGNQQCQITNSFKVISTYLGTTIWKSVSCSDVHALQIRESDSKLFSWGRNPKGQLGYSPNLIVEVGTIDDSQLPYMIGSSNWKYVYQTPYSDKSYQIDENNKLYQFGTNYSGDLGIGSTSTTNYYIFTPTRIGNSDWKCVQNNGYPNRVSTIQLRYTDSILFTWGYNVSSPISVGTTAWKQISGGSSYFLQLRESDSILFSWGTNNNGQLGTGNIISNWTPISVGTTAWKQIQQGEQYSLQIRESDSALFSWGLNDKYQLGTTIIPNYTSSPYLIDNTKIWKTISQQKNYSVQSTIDNTYYQWGSNESGQLGTNEDILLYSSPYHSPYYDIFAYMEQSGTYKMIQKDTINSLHYMSGNLSYIQNNIELTPIKIGSTIWKTVSPGSGFAFQIRQSDNQLFGWGNNFQGNLGTGSTINQYTPLLIGTTSWRQISCGTMHILQIRDTDAALFSWGYNFLNQVIGSATTVNQYTPLFYSSNYNVGFKYISQGMDSSFATYDNNLSVTAGRNLEGQLNIGFNPNQEDITEIKNGCYHTMVLYGSNNVVGSTGSNYYNQCRSAGTTPWKQIQAGCQTSFQIRETDGKLFQWGYSTNGQFGSGGATTLQFPALILGTTSWKQVTSQSGYTGGTLLLSASNELYQCGSNYNGRLGIGNLNISVTTPVKVQDQLHSWIKIFQGIDGSSYQLADITTIVNLSKTFYLRYNLFIQNYMKIYGLAYKRVKLILKLYNNRTIIYHPNIIKNYISNYKIYHPIILKTYTLEFINQYYREKDIILDYSIKRDGIKKTYQLIYKIYHSDILKWYTLNYRLIHPAILKLFDLRYLMQNNMSTLLQYNLVQKIYHPDALKDYSLRYRVKFPNVIRYIPLIYKIYHPDILKEFDLEYKLYDLDIIKQYSLTVVLNKTNIKRYKSQDILYHPDVLKEFDLEYKLYDLDIIKQYSLTAMLHKTNIKIYQLKYILYHPDVLKEFDLEYKLRFPPIIKHYSLTSVLHKTHLKTYRLMQKLLITDIDTNIFSLNYLIVNNKSKTYSLLFVLYQPWIKTFSLKFLLYVSDILKIINFESQVIINYKMDYSLHFYTGVLYGRCQQYYLGYIIQVIRTKTFKLKYSLNKENILFTDINSNYTVLQLKELSYISNYQDPKLLEFPKYLNEFILNKTRQMNINLMYTMNSELKLLNYNILIVLADIINKNFSFNYVFKNSCLKQFELSYTLYVCPVRIGILNASKPRNLDSSYLSY